MGTAANLDQRRPRRPERLSQLYELTNIHGDVAGETDAAGQLQQTFRASEFGVPQGTQPASGYDWLGGKERKAQFASGLTTMGQRVYVPELGRFLQTDPVHGGSANDYDYVNQDPLDQLDLSGTQSIAAVCHGTSGSVYKTGLVITHPHPLSVVKPAVSAQWQGNCTGDVASLEYVRIKMCIQTENSSGSWDMVSCKRRTFKPYELTNMFKQMFAPCRSGTYTYRLKTIVHAKAVSSDFKVHVFKGHSHSNPYTNITC